MVIFLAKHMSMPEYRTDSLKSFVAPIVSIVCFELLILKQPDFGAAMSLAFLALAMLFLSGIKLRYIACLAACATPIIIALIMAPYRLKRITCFLDPWKDPQGCGFQLVQSFIALGSGGLTGVGLGSSRQKLSYLPESHTDFIFSIIGEEFGLIGVIVIIALFLVLFIKGISIANRAKDRFIYYLATGLSLMISLQALINFAVATGMVPTKGLPLPFISYGGSSLLVNMIAIGLLLNLSKGEEETPVLNNREMMAKRMARRNIYGRYNSISR
jgi:cell division protein FtsW